MASGHRIVRDLLDATIHAGMVVEAAVEIRPAEPVARALLDTVIGADAPTEARDVFRVDLKLAQPCAPMIIVIRVEGDRG